MATTPNVIPFATPAKRRVIHRSERTYFAREELSAFLDAAKAYGQREYAMFVFAVAHGARSQEVANLSFRDLQLEKGRVFIARVKGSDSSLQDFQTVCGHSEQQAFVDYITDRGNGEPDEPVFRSRKGGKLDRVSVHRLFKLIAEKAGLPAGKRHVHLLKHTAAMAMVRSGVNAFVIQKALGHRSINSTLAYTKPTDSDASKALASAFQGQF
jgi:integrase/recombinase XerD